MTLHSLMHGRAHSDLARPILLDVTRLVASRWKGSLPTGLDRVAIAYAERLRSRALAVVQYRNITRVFMGDQSQRLFDMLLDPSRRFRREFAWLASRNIARRGSDCSTAGSLYLNVGHTELDSPEHAAWLARSGVRPVYFLHDLIPVRRPELCRPAAVARHTARVKSALTGGAGIIVNSNATASDLTAFSEEIAIACPPVCVAPLAGDALQAGRASAASQEQASAASEEQEPYFLAIGTHEPRRNFALLLEVWTRLAAKIGKSTPRLIIVGQQWKHHAACYNELASSDLHPHVLTLVTKCPDAELAGLIAGARALVMPTLAEGFGLPLVEALAVGTPVIASDLPSLVESGKGIPLLLDPENANAWESAIVAFQADETERERQLEMIGNYSPNTWDDHFAQVEPFLEGLAGAGRGAHAQAVNAIAVGSGSA